MFKGEFLNLSRYDALSGENRNLAIQETALYSLKYNMLKLFTSSISIYVSDIDLYVNFGQDWHPKHTGTYRFSGTVFNQGKRQNNYATTNLFHGILIPITFKQWTLNDTDVADITASGGGVTSIRISAEKFRSREYAPSAGFQNPVGSAVSVWSLKRKSVAHRMLRKFVDIATVKGQYREIWDKGLENGVNDVPWMVARKKQGLNKSIFPSYILNSIIPRILTWSPFLFYYLLLPSDTKMPSSLPFTCPQWLPRWFFEVAIGVDVYFGIRNVDRSAWCSSSLTTITLTFEDLVRVSRFIYLWPNDNFTRLAFDRAPGLKFDRGVCKSTIGEVAWTLREGAQRMYFTIHAPRTRKSQDYVSPSGKQCQRRGAPSWFPWPVQNRAQAFHNPDPVEGIPLLHGISVCQTVVKYMDRRGIYRREPLGFYYMKRHPDPNLAEPIRRSEEGFLLLKFMHVDGCTRSSDEYYGGRNVDFSVKNFDDKALRSEQAQYSPPNTMNLGCENTCIDGGVLIFRIAGLGKSQGGYFFLGPG
ncbi:hypothetical protein IW261DRAFT_1423695 [Armillaria novae-zelandiae]|uniref:Uncharacterized protein n=1 Tax=Armillaria novae-zelandiae TaxID=153914 RepID=A0AA39UCB7_9AGAR|nr:hypothetical protein IW261DRAFT_1423695 [Armillaria novae-zelandiae]